MVGWIGLGWRKGWWGGCLREYLEGVFCGGGIGWDEIVGRSVLEVERLVRIRGFLLWAVVFLLEMGGMLFLTRRFSKVDVWVYRLDVLEYASCQESL